jgi:hypothetical protein
MAHLDGRSARFSLSIGGFLSPPPLSDFPSCAPATPVSQTRGSHRRWPPLFPSTCNFQFDFSARVPAVAIPNARNFREWAPQQVNTLPSMKLRRIWSLSQISISLGTFIIVDSSAQRRAASADNLIAGAVLCPFALALLYFVSRPVLQ